jgi:hypothetical protein
VVGRGHGSAAGNEYIERRLPAGAPQNPHDLLDRQPGLLRQLRGAREALAVPRNGPLQEEAPRCLIACVLLERAERLVP